MTEATFTESYARAQHALRLPAHHGLHLAKSDVRLLVALYEHNAMTQDELSILLHVDSSSVRRSALELTRQGMVEREALSGGPTKPGVPAVVMLTTRGGSVARSVLKAAEPR